jgi:hypothetical protein
MQSAQKFGSICMQNDGNEAVGARGSTMPELAFVPTLERYSGL